MNTKTYAAIHEAAPNYFQIIAMWGVGPVRLSEIYTSRDKARAAATKIMGKHRHLVSVDKLYKIQNQRIKHLFQQARKPKPPEIITDRPDRIVVDCFECNEERLDRIIPIGLREHRYATSRREDRDH